MQRCRIFPKLHSKHTYRVLAIFLFLISLNLVPLPIPIPTSTTSKASLTPTSGWQYVKQITLSNPRESYQIQIHLVLGSGTDSGNTIYIPSDYCENFPSDIRFGSTSDPSTAVQLPQWLERNTTTEAWYWINTTSANYSTIYLFVGNSNANLYSDGDAVFLTYDSHEDGVSGWQQDPSWDSGGGSCTQSSAQAYHGTYSMKHSESGTAFDGVNHEVSQITDASKQIDFWFYAPDTSHIRRFWCTETQDNPDGSHESVYLKFDQYGNINYYDGAYHDIGDYTANEWHHIRLYNFDFSASTFDIDYDGTTLAAGCGFRNTGLSDISYVESYLKGASWYIDCLIVRKYADPEPSISSTGSWQSVSGGNTAPTASNPSPSDGAINVSIPPDYFAITVSDSEGDAMNITWMENSSGTWKTFNTTENVGNGTYYAYNTSWVTDFSTTYWWKVNVSDGTNYNEYTYHFTTISLSPPSGFEAITESSQSINLTWTKPDGADKTYIRYDTKLPEDVTGQPTVLDYFSDTTAYLQGVTLNETYIWVSAKGSSYPGVINVYWRSNKTLKETKSITNAEHNATQIGGILYHNGYIYVADGTAINDMENSKEHIIKLYASNLSFVCDAYSGTTTGYFTEDICYYDGYFFAVFEGTTETGAKKVRKYKENATTGKWEFVKEYDLSSWLPGHSDGISMWKQHGHVYMGITIHDGGYTDASYLYIFEYNLTDDSFTYVDKIPPQTVHYCQGWDAENLTSTAWFADRVAQKIYKVNLTAAFSENWTRDSGNFLCNITGTYYLHTSLDSNTTYYYAAWSYNESQNIYSNNYATAKNTTLEEEERTWQSIQSGWCTFSNSSSWHSLQQGWVTFSNQSSWQSIQSGWATFSNQASWQSLQSGWVTFSNQPSWNSLESGWVSFSNQSSWNSLQSGWVSFSNTSSWHSLESGWVTFGNITGRTWHSLQSGWCSFSNSSSWHQLQSGWSSFSNISSWHSLESGWVTFSSTERTWHSLESGWVTFGNYQDWHSLQSGWVSFSNVSSWHSLQSGWVNFSAEEINWWDTNWLYNKVIYIDNKGWNDYYQICLNVTYDGGGDVSCEGHCNANFSDLRFLQSDNTTLLPYWFEKVVDGEYAIVWVNVSATSMTEEKFLMYYGNPSASSLSDGNSTFEFFDDFLGSSLNTTKWDDDGFGGNPGMSGYYTVHDGYLEYWSTYDTYRILKANYNISDNRSVTWRVRTANATGNANLWEITDNDRSEIIAVKDYDADGDFDFIFRRSGSLIAVEDSISWAPYTYYQITNTKFNQTHGNCSIRTPTNNVYWSSTYSYSSWDTTMYPSIVAEGGKHWYIDWVFVRVYLDNEPSFYSCSEENALPPSPPTNVHLISKGTSWIRLGWTKGTAAERTVIRYSTTSYPSEPEPSNYNGTGTSSNFTGLSPSTTYYFTLWSWNSGGYSTPTYFSATTLPEAPSDFKATSTNTTTISLSWTKGDGADTTVIVRKTGSYPTSITDGVVVYNDTGTSYTDSGLSAGTGYYYRAWSYANGEYSSSYDSAMNYTYPAAPTSISSSATAHTISLSWTKGAGADKTVIRYSTSGYPTSPSDGTLAYNGTDTSTTISGLASETTYYFSFWAYDSESGYYSQDYTTHTATTPYAPPDPSNLVATPVNDTSISLTWSASTDVNSVLVRKTGGYPSSPSDGTVIFNSSGTSYTDTGLTPSTHYYYRVWTYNRGVYSENYAQDDAWTKPQPPQDVDYSLETAGTTANLTITWTKGQGADKTVVRKSANTFPSSPSDGTLVYNGTGTECTDANIDQMWYYRLWSYNESSGLYSDAVNLTFFACWLNCYNESSGEPIENWSVFISDMNGSQVYSAENLQNSQILNTSQLPSGLASFKFTADGYKFRLYYYEITPETSLTINAYLPPESMNTTLYLLYVKDVFDSPIRDALISVRHYNPSSGEYVEVARLYTDAEGRAGVYLIPGDMYKLVISKEGYQTGYFDYTPLPEVYTAEFTLLGSEEGTELPEGLWDNITLSIRPAQTHFNTSVNLTVYFNISCSTGELEWYRIEVYKIRNLTQTETLLYSYNESNPYGGNLSYNIGSEVGTYKVVCTFKKQNFSAVSFERLYYIYEEKLPSIGLVIPAHIYLMILIFLALAAMAFLMRLGAGDLSPIAGIIVFIIGFLIYPVTIAGVSCWYLVIAMGIGYGAYMFIRSGV